jgi:hypothetical protein
VSMSDDYQWRYRRPARSFHDLFAERVPVAVRARRRRLRRFGLVALVAASLTWQSTTWPGNSLVSHALALVQGSDGHLDGDSCPQPS